MLSPETTLLVVIDVQGNLARVVAESESAIRAVGQLVQGSGLLGIPVLLTAQVPEKLGTPSLKLPGFCLSRLTCPGYISVSGRMLVFSRLYAIPGANNCLFAASKPTFAFTNPASICSQEVLRYTWLRTLFLHAIPTIKLSPCRSFPARVCI